MHALIVALVYAITVSFYILTLVFALHNTYFYLIKQDRIKVRNIQLIAFYINTIVVLSLRICQFSIEVSANLGQYEYTSFVLGSVAVLFQLNIGGCMILLMQNI